MRKIAFLINLLFISSFALAEGIPQDFGTTDTLKFGKGTSTDDKELIFDTGDSTSNRKIVVPDSGDSIDLSGDTLKIGDGTASDKTIEANTGSSPAPAIRFNNSLSRWEKSNDGTNYLDIGSGSGGGGINILENSDFEAGLSDWTNSGASTLVDTGTPIFGLKSATWDPSTTGEFLTSDAVSIPVGLQGAECSAISYYLWDSGSSGDIELQVYDGSNVLVKEDLNPTNGVRNKSELLFTCPSSGSISLRYASTTNAAAIQIDNQFLGESIFSTGDSSEIAADMYYPSTTNCTWNRNNTSLGAFGTDSDCPSPTVRTSASGVIVDTTDDDLPTFVFDNLPSGVYQAILSTNLRSTLAGDDGTLALYDLTDSTILDQTYLSNSDAAENHPITLIGSFTMTSPGTKTITLYNKGTGNFEVNNLPAASVDNQTSLLLTRFPLDSSKSISFDQSDWHIDANIFGASPSLGSSAVSSYTGITDSSLQLDINTGSHPVQIACATTEDSSGSTCTGNESIGIAFNIPYAGKYQVCSSFAHQILVSSTSSVNAGFQLVETPNNAQTINQEGNKRISDDFTAGSGNGRIDFPFNLCGEFIFNSAGKKTVRLMYEQGTGGTVTNNVIRGDRSTSVGQPDINFTVKPLTQYKGGINFNNMVSTTKQTGVKINSASIIFSGGTPTIESQTGTWIDSITDNGTGNWTVNFTSGVWASTPRCFGSTVGTLSGRTIQTNTISTSTWNMSIRDSGGNVQDEDADIFCIGQ